MVKNKKGKKDDRIEMLEDDRFGKLCDEVSEIHTCIHGNGKPGLKTEMAQNKIKVNICLWVLGILITALIGVSVKNSFEIKQTEKGEKNITAIRG